MKAEVVVKEEEVVKEAVVRAMAAVSQADPPRRGAKAEANDEDKVVCR